MNYLKKLKVLEKKASQLNCKIILDLITRTKKAVKGKDRTKTQVYYKVDKLGCIDYYICNLIEIIDAKRTGRVKVLKELSNIIDSVMSKY